MPVYEYQCSDCRRVHEVMQRFSDPLLTECPECQGSVTKLMSMTSFALKGSGWYTSDYKRSSSSPAASSCATASGGEACGTSACPASSGA